MSEADWKQHFLNMAQGKVNKRKHYYIVKNVTPTQQAVEMAKDRVKTIKVQICIKKKRHREKTTNKRKNKKCLTLKRCKN